MCFPALLRKSYHINCSRSKWLNEWERAVSSRPFDCLAVLKLCLPGFTSDSKTFIAFIPALAVQKLTYHREIALVKLPKEH